MARDFSEEDVDAGSADPQEDRLANASPRGEQAIAAALARAERLLDDDEEAAAFVLDGLSRHIIGRWYARRSRAAPAPDQVLANLEEVDEELAWQLRHVLRAPDAHARLIHLRVLFQMLSS